MDPNQMPAVIMDSGSGYTKVGFAGNLEPSFVVPSLVAVRQSSSNSLPFTPRNSAQPIASPAGFRLGSWTGIPAGVSSQKSQQTQAVLSDLDYRCGQDAIAASRSASHVLVQPINKGQVVDWDAAEQLWHHCTFSLLRVDPSEHLFVMADSPMCPPEHREFTGEVLFETFNVAGLHLSPHASLALAAANAAGQSSMTGLVVDVGDGGTTITPVVEGYLLGGCVRFLPIGGSHATAFVQQLMKDRGEPVPGHDSLEVARKVKELHGYACSDIVKEFSKHDKEPSKYRKVWSATNSKTGAAYRCDVGHERFLAAEVYFTPEIAGVDKCLPLPVAIDMAVQSTPIDVRRSLYKNIVLAGGSSLFKDFARRLQRDVKKIVEERTAAAASKASSAEARSSSSASQAVEVSVLSHPAQEYAAWIGGSLLASSPAFPSVCISRADYYEQGARVCRRNSAFPTS